MSLLKEETNSVKNTNSSNNSINKRPKSQKLVLIGDSNVGKTSIIDQFIDGRFGETKPSVGALHKLKTIKLNNSNYSYNDNSNNNNNLNENTNNNSNLNNLEEVQLDIWDTAGQEKFKSIVPMYYKGSKGIMIIYDITSMESFEGAKKWIGDIESSYNLAILFLVGNKVDLKENRAVSTEVAQSYALSKNITHFECSAKSNEGILEVFTAIAGKMPKNVENNNSNKLSLNKSPAKSEDSGCCY